MRQNFLDNNRDNYRMPLRAKGIQVPKGPSTKLFGTETICFWQKLWYFFRSLVYNPFYLKSIFSNILKAPLEFFRYLASTYWWIPMWHRAQHGTNGPRWSCRWKRVRSTLTIEVFVHSDSSFSSSSCQGQGIALGSRLLCWAKTWSTSSFWHARMCPGMLKRSPGNFG